MDIVIHIGDFTDNNRSRPFLPVKLTIFMATIPDQNGP